MNTAAGDQPTAIQPAAPSERLSRTLFSIDLRSLAALRITLGVLILADLALRSRDLVALYTDRGVMPADFVLEQYGFFSRFSLHWWASGSVAMTVGVFAVHALAALALTVGFHARIATIACWYLAASLFKRNPCTFTAGDATLVTMLLWMLFLPIAARWSLDARRRPALRAVANPFFSAATVAILIQVCCIYWFSAILKAHYPIWQELTAVHNALHRDWVVAGPGIWFSQFKSALPILTLSVLLFELLGPFLAFLPAYNAAGRLVAIGCFGLLHLVFGLFFTLGMFQWFSFAVWLVFLPTAFWEWLARCFNRPALRDARGGSQWPASPVWRRAIAVLASVALVYVLILNVMNNGAPKTFNRLGKPVVLFRLPARALQIDPYWAMFTKEEPLDGWWVIFGERADGSTVDLLTGASPVSWDKPAVPSKVLPNARWVHFMNNYAGAQTDPVRRWTPVARFFADRWNNSRPADEQLRRVTIGWSLESNDPIRGEVYTPHYFVVYDVETTLRNPPEG